tara:strand:+ start:381 stop:815 length:435 start_codon:yes stop_codon:yes gene_type:complete
MTLDDIMSEWEKDKKMDSTALDRESLNVPELHHKYHKLLSEENKLYRRMSARVEELRAVRWMYFSGKLDEDTLDKNGWEPFDLKVVKQDVQRFIDGDSVLNKYVIELGDQKEKIDLIKSIMSMISNRSFQINNAIKWNQFLTGQ